MESFKPKNNYDKSLNLKTRQILSESTFDCTFKSTNKPNISNSILNNNVISRLSPFDNTTSRTNFNISMNKSFYDNSKEVLESLTNVKSISPELKESKTNLNYDYAVSTVDNNYTSIYDVYKSSRYDNKIDYANQSTYNNFNNNSNFNEFKPLKSSFNQLDQLKDYLRKENFELKNRINRNDYQRNISSSKLTNNNITRNSTSKSYSKTNNLKNLSKSKLNTNSSKSKIMSKINLEKSKEKQIKENKNKEIRELKQKLEELSNQNQELIETKSQLIAQSNENKSKIDKLQKLKQNNEKLEKDKENLISYQNDSLVRRSKNQEVIRSIQREIINLKQKLNIY